MIQGRVCLKGEDSEHENEFQASFPDFMGHPVWPVGPFPGLFFPSACRVAAAEIRPRNVDRGCAGGVWPAGFRQYRALLHPDAAEGCGGRRKAEAASGVIQRSRVMCGAGNYVYIGEEWNL